MLLPPEVKLQILDIPEKYRAACLGVWTLCSDWSNNNRTDGYVPIDIVFQFGGKPEVKDWLVKARLWQPDGIGVKFVTRHGASRDASLERMRRFRERKKLAEQQKQEPVTRHQTSRDASPDFETALSPSNQPTKVTIPSKNLPTELPIQLSPLTGKPLPKPGTVLAERPKAKRRKPRTPLPENWEPSLETLSKMSEKYPYLDLKAELEQFKDRNKATGDLYADWDAAFRTWCGRARKFGASGNGATIPPNTIATSDVRAMQMQSVRKELHGMMNPQLGLES